MKNENSTLKYLKTNLLASHEQNYKKIMYCMFHQKSDKLLDLDLQKQYLQSEAQR